jgi:stringent starvation protein B
VDLPSTKPYLIRAIHQWCCDNGFTPYLAVAVDARTRVPREHVRDGQIVLNVDYEATGNLSDRQRRHHFPGAFRWRRARHIDPDWQRCRHLRT